MNYKKVYNDLMVKYKNLALKKDKKVYLETHHITARCLNGSDDKINKVNLTAKAHFVAHHLLTKIYPKNNKIWFSFWMFVTKNSRGYNREGYFVSASLYEKVKTKFAAELSAVRTGVKFTEEHCKKISLATLNRKKCICEFCGKHIIHAMYARWHGKNCKLNPDVSQELLLKRKEVMGTKMRGKSHNDETKMKIGIGVRAAHAII